ncbi:MAG: pilus assembly PilX family protein [Sulfuricaulis sp.]
MREVAFMRVCNGRQRGTALIISLVILTLLTILGVSALNMSSLRSLITRNDQQRQLSFEAAESTLKIGQMYAETLVNPPISNGVLSDGSSKTGVYVYSGSGSYKDVSPSTMSWNSGDSITATNGRYIVEFLGQRPAAGGDPSVKVLYYRIVAQSSSGGLGTNTLLEGTLGVAKGP